MPRGRLVVVALALLGLVACTSHPPASSDDRFYVAIGDSYVSGPGIADQDAASPECVRSDHNYAHLVAARLKRVTLVDVSCGGATTATATQGRENQLGNPTAPQLDALTPETKLVTVGIGANDDALYLGMFVACLIKKSATDAACRAFSTDRANAVFPATRDRVAAILAQVKKRAPRARVLLVGYLRIVPDSGDCPELPMTETGRAGAMTVEVGLTKALRAAARDEDVPFVDVRPASRGHDVCAGRDAWVNGTATSVGDGTVLHPNKAGMRAVAGLVSKAIGDF